MLKALGLHDAHNTNVKHSNSFGCQEYTLLEVDDALLQGILHGGVVIKGCENDEAVLCSNSATYAVKFVSTSNTVLLVPPTNGSVIGRDEGKEGEEEGETAVVATVNGFIEVREIAPRIDKLRTLLAQKPYTEEVDTVDGEDEHEGLYTWDYLVSNVQASEVELLLALKDLGAVQIGGHWRTVDLSVMKGLLDVLLLNAVSHDWDLKALTEPDVISTMRVDGFSDKLVRHCLATYGVERDCFEARTWALDHTIICVHYARGLLPHKDRWNSEEFMDRWQKLLPAEIKPSLDMLGGEALVEKVGTHSWIQGFSRSSLPTKPADRFAALFKARPKWLLEDLQTYISDLRVPGLTVEAMLLKFTRKTQPNATWPPVYSARIVTNNVMCKN